MGRLIFVIEHKMLLIFFFYCAPFFFKLAAQVLLKIKVSVEPCLVSVVVLMRGCSGTGEYEAGKEKITVYLLQKTRLHHWLLLIIHHMLRDTEAVSDSWTNWLFSMNLLNRFANHNKQFIHELEWSDCSCSRVENSLIQMIRLEQVNWTHK